MANNPRKPEDEEELLSQLEDPQSNLDYQQLLSKFTPPSGMGDSVEARSSAPATLPAMGMADSLSARSGVDMTTDNEPAQSSRIAAIRDVVGKINQRRQAASEELPGKPIVSDEDVELKEARKKDALMSLFSGLSDAGALFAYGASRGHSSYDPNRFASSNLATKTLLENREIAQKRIDQKTTKELSDPNSASSQNARKTYEQVTGIKLPDSVSAYALERSKTLSDLVQASLRARELAALRQERSLDRELARQDMNARFAQRLEEKQREEIDKKVSNLSKTLNKEGIPEQITLLKNIDELTGGLESKKDIPGYGILGGMVPDVAVSKEGEQLRSNIQKLVNAILRSRSGQAVTSSEEQRLLKELGSGTMMRESKLREGLKLVRDITQRQMQQIEAGTSPKALEEYRTREGAISSKDLDIGKVGMSLSSIDEARISKFMQDNPGVSREAAIKAYEDFKKKNGR